MNTVNFKSILLTATLAASAFIAAPAVKAGEISCGQLGGAGQMCSKWVGQLKGGNAYEVTYTNFDGDEDLTVICNGRSLVDWSSYGNLSQNQAEWVASQFCALPG